MNGNDVVMDDQPVQGFENNVSLQLLAPGRNVQRQDFFKRRQHRFCRQDNGDIPLVLIVDRGAFPGVRQEQEGGQEAKGADAIFLYHLYHQKKKNCQGCCPPGLSVEV